MEPFKLRFSTKRRINYLQLGFANDWLIPKEKMRPRYWSKSEQDNPQNPPAQMENSDLQN